MGAQKQFEVVDIGRDNTVDIVQISYNVNNETRENEKNTLITLSLLSKNKCTHSSTFSWMEFFGAELVGKCGYKQAWKTFIAGWKKKKNNNNISSQLTQPNETKAKTKTKQNEKFANIQINKQTKGKDTQSSTKITPFHPYWSVDFQLHNDTNYHRITLYVDVYSVHEVYREQAQKECCCGDADCVQCFVLFTFTGAAAIVLLLLLLLLKWRCTTMPTTHSHTKKPKW